MSKKIKFASEVVKKLKIHCGNCNKKLNLVGYYTEENDFEINEVP